MNGKNLATPERLYVTQIGKYIEGITGKPQRILYLNDETQNADFAPFIFNLDDVKSTPSTIIICDVEANVDLVTWDDRGGFHLFCDKGTTRCNSDVMHTVLWNNNSEVQGVYPNEYISYEGALNGILTIHPANCLPEKQEEWLKDISLMPSIRTE